MAGVSTQPAHTLRVNTHNGHGSFGRHSHVVKAHTRRDAAAAPTVMEGGKDGRRKEGRRKEGRKQGREGGKAGRKERREEGEKEREGRKERMERK